MKIADLMGLARKTLRGRWVALPVAGFAIGAFCLCFAGAAFTTVQREKAQPFELIVSAQGNRNIADDTIAKVLDIPGVAAATPVLPVAATVKAGSYSAELTLTGIDGAYLGPFEQGGVFPQDSAMPYLVLNRAACRRFSNDTLGDEADGSDDGADVALPAIDWMNAGFTVQMGDGTRPVVSRVCGILAGDGKEQEPAATISLPVAKALLRAGGQNPAVLSARVRVDNIGAANGVARAVAALGLAAEDTNAALQEKWDGQMKELGYLLAAGLFSLLCAAVLLAAWRKISLLEQGQAWAMLLWMGLRQREIDRVFLLQAGMLALFGAAIGIAVAVALPQFLPQELMGKSIFMLLLHWKWR